MNQSGNKEKENGQFETSVFVGVDLPLAEIEILVTEWASDYDGVGSNLPGHVQNLGAELQHDVTFWQTEGGSAAFCFEREIWNVCAKGCQNPIHGDGIFWVIELGPLWGSCENASIVRR